MNPNRTSVTTYSIIGYICQKKTYDARWDETEMLRFAGITTRYQNQDFLLGIMIATKINSRDEGESIVFDWAR